MGHFQQNSDFFSRVLEKMTNFDNIFPMIFVSVVGGYTGVNLYMSQ